MERVGPRAPLSDVLLHSACIGCSVIGVTDASAQFNVNMRRNGVARAIDERRVQLLSKHEVGGQRTPRNRPRLFCAGDQGRELTDVVEPLEKSVAGLDLHQNGCALHLAQWKRERDKPKVRAASAEPPELKCADSIPRGIGDDLVLDDLVTAIDTSSRANLHAIRW